MYGVETPVVIKICDAILVSQCTLARGTFYYSAQSETYLVALWAE